MIQRMKNKKFLLFILSVCFTCLPSNAQWLWEKSKLDEIKREIERNNSSAIYQPVLKKLITEAEQTLGKNTYSVTFKESLPPSGDKHDYVSLSRYVWPDPAKHNGLPYITRDGESNPELEKYDRNPLGNMAEAVNTLTLAYFYTNEERYASKAMDFIRTWFLDEETKMNPNLNYAQFIPGRNESKGRPFGLIDTYSFVEMLNSLKLLEGSINYTKEDDIQLKKWFTEFAHWWQTSQQGIEENNAKNNHGLAYDVQLVSFLLFAGDVNGAKKVINAFPERRLFKHIEPDGKQPQELRRTLAFHYSEYNIRHMIDMFAIAKSIGIDLINVESKDGRNFYKALDFLIQYLGKDLSEWPYQQISGWEETQQAFCEDLYRVVALDPSRTDYLKIYKAYATSAYLERLKLLYGDL